MPQARAAPLSVTERAARSKRDNDTTPEVNGNGSSANGTGTPTKAPSHVEY